MKEKDISIAHVYASPSLRCVESACSLLQGKLITHVNYIVYNLKIGWLFIEFSVPFQHKYGYIRYEYNLKI